MNRNFIKSIDFDLDIMMEINKCSFGCCPKSRDLSQILYGNGLLLNRRIRNAILREVRNA